MYSLGRWDSVLSQTASLQLPREKLIALYEQVVMELLEAGEKDLAREVHSIYSIHTTRLLNL